MRSDDKDKLIEKGVHAFRRLHPLRNWESPDAKEAVSAAADVFEEELTKILESLIARIDEQVSAIDVREQNDASLGALMALNSIRNIINDVL